MKKILFCLLAAFAFSGFTGIRCHAQKLVAIMNVVDKKGAFEDAEELLIRGLMTDAVTRTPGYEGYDRVDVGAIMNEHEFQRSGMVSPDGVRKLGEMTGCDYVMVVEIMKMGEERIVFSSKIVNVETGQIANSGTITGYNDMADHEDSCTRLAEKLLGGL